MIEWFLPDVRLWFEILATFVVFWWSGATGSEAVHQSTSELRDYLDDEEPVQPRQKFLSLRFRVIYLRV